MKLSGSITAIFILFLSQSVFAQTATTNLVVRESRQIDPNTNWLVVSQTQGMTCSLKIDPKPWIRNLREGTKLRIVSALRQIKLPKPTRADLETEFRAFTGGGLTLPKEIKTLDQYIEYVGKTLSGGGLNVGDHTRLMGVRVYEFDVQSLESGQAYMIACELFKSGKISMDEILQEMLTGNPFHAPLNLLVPETNL